MSVKVIFITFVLSQFVCFTPQTEAAQLQTGDLILVSLPCAVCALIEAEESSRYSHIGIAVQQEHEWKVLESWSTVKATPLEEFLGRRRKGSPIGIFRHRTQAFSNDQLWQVFKARYEGLPYDANFLWNNHDQKKEKLYCSEFVLKFLKNFNIELPEPKPMHFSYRRDLWERYFRGPAPEGELGVSPQDFVISSTYLQIDSIPSNLE